MTKCDSQQTSPMRANDPKFLSPSDNKTMYPVGSDLSPRTPTSQRVVSDFL